jgi:hypothetical protein
MYRACRDAVELTADEFFASADGVCLYVNVRGRAFRVRFDSPDGPGFAQGTTDVGADEALAIATTVATSTRPTSGRYSIAWLLNWRPGRAAKRSRLTFREASRSVIPLTPFRHGQWRDAADHWRRSHATHRSEPRTNDVQALQSRNVQNTEDVVGTPFRHPAGRAL